MTAAFRDAAARVTDRLFGGLLDWATARTITRRDANTGADTAASLWRTINATRVSLAEAIGPPERAAWLLQMVGPYNSLADHETEPVRQAGYRSASAWMNLLAHTEYVQSGSATIDQSTMLLVSPLADAVRSTCTSTIDGLLRTIEVGARAQLLSTLVASLREESRIAYEAVAAVAAVYRAIVLDAVEREQEL